MLAKDSKKILNNNDIFYDELYEDFISLGKLLYDNYKNRIIKIEKNEVPLDRLIKFKNETNNMEDYENNNKRVQIIEEWLKSKRYVYLKEFDPDSSDKKIEIFFLSDLAIFSYMVLSSLNNYFLEKDAKLKTKRAKHAQKFEQVYKETLFNNISFDTFTLVKSNKLDEFISLINFYMSQYEIGAGKLILIEHSKLNYNSSSNNPKDKYRYTKYFDNIYGLYWFILKMQIYSILNGYRIVNMCSCGNMITGKADRCSSCRKLYDTFRHNIENQEKRKKNKCK